MSTDPHDIEDEESPQRGKRKAQMGLNQRRKNLTVLEDTSKKKWKNKPQTGRKYVNYVSDKCVKWQMTMQCIMRDIHESCLSYGIVTGIHS